MKKNCKLVKDENKRLQTCNCIENENKQLIQCWKQDMPCSDTCAAWKYAKPKKQIICMALPYYDEIADYSVGVKNDTKTK